MAYFVAIMRTKFLIVTLFCASAFLLFAHAALAEQACLRGGSGNCVTVATDGGAASVHNEQAMHMLDASNSHNVISLADGTLIAAVAKVSTDANNQYSTTNNNTGVYKQIVRYKIVLKVSTDGGVTWIEPGTQGSWYVDDVLDIDGTLASTDAAGFLGFSLAVSEGPSKTHVFLAHALSCQGSDAAPNCPFPIGNGQWESNGAIYLEVLEFTKEKTFTSKLSKAITKWAEAGACTWGINVCFGKGYGADHPNIWVSNTANPIVAVTFSAYKGDTCSAALCAGQYVGDSGVGSVGQYGIWGIVDTSASPMTFSYNPPTRFGEIIEGVNLHDERYAFVSSLASSPSVLHPVAFWGYNNPNAAPTTLDDLQMTFYDTAWTNKGRLDVNLNAAGEPGIIGLIKAGAISNTTTPPTPVPIFAATASNDTYGYQGSSGANKYIHLAFMSDLGALSGYTTAMPYYAKFIVPLSGASITHVQTLPLADYDSISPTYRRFHGTTQALLDNGGPTIGVSSQFVYIGLPAAATSAFEPRQTNVYYARINAQRTQTATSSAPTYYWNQASMLDLDASVASPTYKDILYSKMTQNDGGFGYATPVIPPNIYFRNDFDLTTSPTNVFNPPMVFARNRSGAITTPCTSSTGCVASFSGEPDTNGIRGWAWASTVGWLSLSCDNLQTCYHKRPPYSLQPVEGSYYGVSQVTNPLVTQKPLLGRAWNDKVGYVSFDRKDSMRAGNACGNPPVDPTNPTAFQITGCAKLTNSIYDTDVIIELTSADNINLFPAGPGGPYFVLIDREIVSYTLRVGASLSGTVTRGVSGSRYSSVPRDHEAGAPVFYLGTSNPTNNDIDIFKGTSQNDSTTFEVKGWARAISWVDYQNSYCGVNIGSGFAPPCDKEWGWIKLNGNWQTVNRGKYAAGQGTNSLTATSVDGYPDVVGGNNQSIRIQGITSGDFVYTLLDKATRIFSLSSALPNPVVGTPEITWISRLSADINNTTSTTIPLASIDGLLPSGKIEIVRNDDSVAEVITYAKIDIPTKSLTNLTTTNVTTPTVPAGSYATTDVYIRQLRETGNYGTYALATAAASPELTVLGFAWSAPNTDTPTADPFASRYRNNISGFGWINFQPNKLELLYPYLRTLFSDIYAAGDVSLIKPDDTLSPSQYSSTYLIQKTGDILEFAGQQQTVAGAWQRCRIACGGAPTCEAICDTYLKQTLASPDIPSVSIKDKETQGLGKLPDYDALADMVTDCRDRDRNSVACPLATEQVGRKRASLLGANPDPALLIPYKTEAKTGFNKYGHRVILCRPNPELSLGYQAVFAQVFNGSEYNPVECDFDSDTSMTGHTFRRANPNWSADINTTCTQAEGCPLTKKVISTAPTVYVIPDDLGDSMILLIDDTHLQFDNGAYSDSTQVAYSGAVTFLVPGTVFVYDSFMRYCNNAPSGLDQGCLVSPSPENIENMSNVHDVKQIASSAWVVKGIAQFWLSPFSGLYPNGQPKHYVVGAWVVTGENTNTYQIYEATPGTFASRISLLAQNLQFNLSGLVVAQRFLLPSEYLEQDSQGRVVAPSENFTYDGRAVVNPPPGLADLVSGLPKIQKVTP